MIRVVSDKYYRPKFNCYNRRELRKLFPIKFFRSNCCEPVLFSAPPIHLIDEKYVTKLFVKLSPHQRFAVTDGTKIVGYVLFSTYYKLHNIY